MTSEVNGQRMASKWLAFVTSVENPMIRGNKVGDKVDDKVKRALKRMDNGMIEYLKPGEQVHINQATRKSDSYVSFSEKILQMVAASIEVPYELMSGDYAKLSYSLLRAKRNDFCSSLKPKWQDIVDDFCTPIFEAWLDAEWLSGRLDLPNDFMINKQKYRRCSWIIPGMPYVDPLKDARADIDLRNAGIKSSKEII